jgi:DNA-binding transcriptional LysR family regulator
LILKAFCDRFPEVEIRLEEGSTSEQVAALRAGEIDVGIVHPPVGGGGIELTPLADEPLAVVLPDWHVLAARSRLNLATLAEEPFVLFPRRRAPGYYDLILALCHAAGFSPNVVQEAPHQRTILSLVAAGIGVSVVPQSMRNLRLPQIAYRPLRGTRGSFRIALAVRSGGMSPVVAGFRQAARDAAIGRATMAIAP